MTIPLSKRNAYRESPEYVPSPATELQHEYTKLIAAYSALDGIAERVDIGDHNSNVFYGALRIIETIIPRIGEIQEAIQA